jgi:tetratricopeptide (TPR) repeat protein/SAM-dependent methyltransferase
MRDIERIGVSQVTPEVDDSPAAISRISAVALIDEGYTFEKQGRIPEAMARYDAAVQVDPKCARAHMNRGNILLAGAQFDAARSAYQLAITCDPNYASAHFNLGNLNCRTGQLESALRNYQAAVANRPDFADAFVAMGNVLDNLGRAAQAIESYERALVINPGYAEVHYNLGLLAEKQGQDSQAASSLRRAVEINPNFARAHIALARSLSALGQLDASVASLRSALSIEPESAEILYFLAMVLLSIGKTPEALQLIIPSLERDPTSATKMAFVHCIARARFVTDDSRTRPLLITAITEPWGIPCELCRPALSLILLNPRIGDCVRLASRAWPARLPTSALFGANGLAALEADLLLRELLKVAPVTTIEFERFLTCARHALLKTVSGEELSDPTETAALQFHAALAQQCFVNEYVFDCGHREMLAAVTCRAKLIQLLDSGEVVPPILLLVVAAYFPLYTLRGASRLLASNYTNAIQDVLRQQISEPLEEKALRAGIQCLTSIAGGVSEEVRDLYEQNPYPRWVKLPIRDNQAPNFNGELRRMLPFGSFTPMPDDSAPDVLIAGCGTGSHPIIAAQRFRGVRVLALDLSVSSLSYAQRKTRELRITNIEYAQADILNLGDIARTFDIIESVGVLHHLADPFAGWRTLLSRLRPGGFMALGFYSELARKHVVNAREYIAARGYASTHEEIRRFRQDLTAGGAGVDLQWLSEVPDFYSTSECRDLLFHVQEHRLTLGQIEAFLAEVGLHFIGFELDPHAIHRYRERFASDRSGTNLRNWAQFEAENPDTFVGMYRFWIQKPNRN